MFCALLVATLFWRDQSLGPNLAYGTAPGEQREVVLADGSKLFLDVDTQVQVRYAERTRDVLLKKGEVFFVVSHDPARPFRVGSGDSRVTVLGTQFSVRRNAQALAVAVKQGRVALQPSLEKDAEHVLLAGDSARLDLAEQRLELGHVAPEQVASWRDGQLVFRDKPLGELVEELSRYRAAPIRLGRSPACRQAGLRYGADRPPRRFSPRPAGAIAGAGAAAGWWRGADPGALRRVVSINENIFHSHMWVFSLLRLLCCPSPLPATSSSHLGRVPA